MKIATILLVCQIGVTGADTQCSDSLGNCAAKPRSSLMQLKTLKQKQQLQTTFGAQLASFQKFTDEMVAKYGRDDNDNFTDPMIQTAVSTVLDFIQEMHSSLLTYHDQDVELAGGCSAQKISSVCEETYLNTEIIGNINLYNGTANTNHDNFLTCMGSRSTECTNENLFCSRYDSYRQQSTALLPTNGFVLGDGVSRQYLPPCVSTDFDEDDIRANHETNPSKLKIMEKCLVETEKWLNGEFPPEGFTSASITSAVTGDNRRDGLWPHYKQCTRDKDKCDKYEDDCKKKQSDFEESYCAYEMHWDSKCGAWSTCAESAKTDCKKGEGHCAQIAQNVMGRKADNETGMRLECLLQVLFGEYHPTEDAELKFSARLPSDKRMEALTNCTSQTYDTTDWDIECEVGDTTAPAICTGTCPREPFTDVFKQAYYFDEGLKDEDKDLLKDDPKQHGIDMHIFPSSLACKLLDGHESYNCGGKLTTTM